MIKIALLALAFAVAFLAATADDGMSICLKKHSYETCFHQLNR